MAERSRWGGGRRRQGRPGFYFILAMLGTLLLDLPGAWLLPAAALSVAFLLLFLLSVRGGCPQAPASRLFRPATDTDLPLRQARIPGGGFA